MSKINVFFIPHDGQVQGKRLPYVDMCVISRTLGQHKQERNTANKTDEMLNRWLAISFLNPCWPLSMPFNIRKGKEKLDVKVWKWIVLFSECIILFHFPLIKCIFFSQLSNTDITDIFRKLFSLVYPIFSNFSNKSEN